MLKKECCKKCCNAYSEWKTVNQMSVLRWGIYDENRWKKETIICPLEYVEGDNKRKITDEPPSKCPFYLEHVI